MLGFDALFPGLAGRSLRRMPVLVSLTVSTDCSNRRNANEATSHGGSFDQ